MDADPAVTFGPFVAERPVARGGMGEVWRAVHPPTALPVAVKVLYGERASRGHAQLIQETRLLARLDHPHVATVLDRGTVTALAADRSGGRLVAGSPWLAIEWVGGGSLDQRTRPARWSAVLGIARPLLRALAHAHARGVLHRDLKPANVLLLDTDELGAQRLPVLTDFGLAAALGDPGTEGLRPGGTPEFMAPEQWLGGDRAPIGPWTDLYAFGCLLYWLVCGTTPFAGTVPDLHGMHLHARLPPLRRPIGVPEGLVGLLERLTAKAPDDRPATAAEVAWALDRLGPAPDEAVAPANATSGRETLDLDALDTWDEPPASAGETPVGAMAGTRPPVPRSWSQPPGRRNPAIAGAGLALWGLRSPALVGREAERDRLWQALVDVSEGARPRIVVIGGPGGAGKSHLAAWFVERATETGAADAIGVRSDETTWLGGLARWLGPCPPDPAQIRRRLAVRVGRPLDDLVGWLAGDPPPDALAVLRRTVSAITAARPLIVWIDDAAGHGELLDHARALVSDPELHDLLVVVTVADDAPLRPGSGARRIEVGPLDTSEITRLAQEGLGLDAATARAVAEVSSGLPLLAVQIVGGWAASGRLMPGPLGFSGPITELPAAVVDRWRAVADAVAARHGPDAVAAMDAAAALGDALTLPRWVAVTDLPPERLDGIASDLEQARALRDAASVPRFAHRLVRHAWAESARERGTWSAVNGRCAALAEREGRRSDLALHAFEAGDLAVARPLLRERALARRADDAYGALDDMRKARAAGAALGGDPHGADALDELAELFAIAWDVGAHEELVPEVHAGVDAARARGDANREGRLVNQLADLARKSGDLAKARAMWERCRELGRVPGAERFAVVATRRLGRLAMERADHAEALALGHAALTLAESSDVPALERFRVRFDLGCAYEQAYAFAEAARWYRAAADHPGVDDLERAQALSGLAEVARRTGDLATAEAGYLEVVRVLEARGTVSLGVVLLNLGLLHIAREELHAAEAVAARARRILQGGGEAVHVGLAWLIGATVTALQGRREEHRWHAEHALDLLEPAAYVDDDLATLAGRCALACRDAGDEALADRWARYEAGSRLRLGAQPR